MAALKSCLTSLCNSYLLDCKQRPTPYTVNEWGQLKNVKCDGCFGSATHLIVTFIIIIIIKAFPFASSQTLLQPFALGKQHMLREAQTNVYKQSRKLQS